ncbi:hypothetical protein J437_LFUL019468 [Ladona fulva]|uniref:1-acylglycerol-3-phosphate O-acyltransferase n=1 Tax=Ladona fulva TaxID=123851 RepID=A0A8K0P8E2_LADFU|nr:hypothetical protein J437_LFUL019468 [Ladona fulva]
MGVKWEVRGGNILDELAGRTGSRKEPKGAIFIANHQSTLDTLGMISIWDRLHPMAAVIKKEVFYVWPFGLAAYLAGSIYIDRSRGRTALYSIESCAHRVAKDKIKMFVFPEGTRNRANCSWGDDGAQKHLLPFKSGAFRAAISVGIPLVPVVYSPYTFVDEKRLLFDHGTLFIYAFLFRLPATQLLVDNDL